jgi:2-keto-3-deoxy-6-phosphogluconate aldolase
MSERVEWAVQYIRPGGTVARIYFDSDKERARKVADVLADAGAELIELHVRSAQATSGARPTLEGG